MYPIEKQKSNWLPLIVGAFLFILPSLLTADNNVTVPEPDGNETIESLIGKARQLVNSNLDSASYYVDQANALAIKAEDYSSSVYLIREKGYYYEINNQLESALSIYEEALKNALLAKNVDLTLDVYTDLAIANRKIGNYEDTRNYYNLAINLSKKEKNLKGLEYAYHGLGYLYETIGDYESAVQHYLQSLKIAEQRDEKPGIVTTLQNIATTYEKIGNIDQSLETIEKAYKLSLEVGDSMLITKALHDYGTILDTDNQLEAALEKFKTSLLINQKIMSKGTIARSYWSIADIYIKMGLFEYAEQNLSEGLKYVDYLKNEDKAILYNKLGQLFYLKNDLSSAEEAFLTSLEIAQSHQFIELVQKNSYELYELNRKKGEADLALQYLENSTALKDSIFNSNQSKSLAELQFRYNLEKSEKQIQELELRQKEFLLTGTTITFIVLLVLMGLFIRLKVKNNSVLKSKKEEIERQNVKLKESNVVLEQFAYVAAHDLKEPLRSIGGFINLLQRRYGKDFNEEANEYMSLVKGGVNRMNDLLNALLQYSTLSIQTAAIDKIDVNKVIHDVTKNLEQLIEQKKAQIIYSTHLSSIKMKEIHLTQLFQNLIGNALKFSAKDCRIEIQGKKQKDRIIYTVKDNGIGIEKEYANKIFNLFHKLDRAKEGQGIGLAICKNIVDKYNGDIWFESTPGEGTTFFLSFPDELVD